MGHRYASATHSVFARSLCGGSGPEEEEEEGAAVVLRSVMAVPIPLTTMPVSPSKSNFTWNLNNIQNFMKTRSCRFGDCYYCKMLPEYSTCLG